MSYFVYIVKCADGTLYTGYTTDIKKRITEHNGEGNSKTAKAAGARYTRSRRPVHLIHFEELLSRSDALKREAEIKSLTRQQKFLLCKESKNKHV